VREGGLAGCLAGRRAFSGFSLVEARMSNGD
jgi:hypothetical protein